MASEWLALGGLAVLLLAAMLALTLWRTLRREDKLLLAVERLQNSLDLAETVGRVGTWTLDRKTETVEWSDQVFWIHERPFHRGMPTLEEALGYYHPDDRQLVADHVERALANGEDFEFRARLITDQGRTRQVLSRSMCQFDRNGEVIGAFGSFIDVSTIEDVGEAVFFVDVDRMQSALN